MTTTVRNMEERSMGYFYFIALVAALGGGLFGYDTAVISGTISMVLWISRKKSVG